MVRVQRTTENFESVWVATSLTPLGSAAAFNSTFDWATASGLYQYTPDLVGDTIRDNPVLPHGQNVPGTVTWQLDTGASITPHKGTITFSFLDSAHTTGMYNRPQEGFPEGFGFSSFTPEQRDAARIAIQNWDDLIAVDFREVNGSGGADITLANTTTGPAQAWAYVPYDYAEIYTAAFGPQYNAFHRYDKFVGDVWIADPQINGSNAQLDPGFYGLQTLNHELGHSLGLSHPGNYNFSDDNDGDGIPDPITYDGDAFYFQDSHQYTIMSYFDSYETGAQNIDWNLMRFVYPSTPMVDDVFVIQQKYGVETDTRTGDTTYGFNATDDVWNEAMRFEDGEMSTIFTIWDAGGNDTLDLSGYYTDSVIDLREGAYSSAGGWGAYDPDQIGTAPTLAEINANNAAAGLPNRSAFLFEVYFNGVEGSNEGLSWFEITGTGEQYLMEQNIGIAYGAIIENAVGGEGNDRINGNQADNQFWGNGGSDTFVFADYSGSLPRPDADGTYVTIEDNSVDSVMDFETGVDTIDLTEFGEDLDYADLTIQTVGTTNTISFDNDGDDFTFIVYGTLVESDFLFG